MKNRYHSQNSIMFFFAMFLILGSCQKTPYQKVENGIVVSVKKSHNQAAHKIRLQVVTDNIVRVSATPNSQFPETPSLMLNESLKSGAEFAVSIQGDTVSLSTMAIRAHIFKSTGEVLFTDLVGNTILAEKAGGGKSFNPITIEGERFLAVKQQFESFPNEGLYGLGANQTEYMNLKGKDADLFQYNTQAVVPFLVSTRNFGILWDNNSRTMFGDSREMQNINSLKLYDKDGKEGGITAIYSNKNDKSKIFTTRIEQEINYQFIPDLTKLPEGFDLNEGAVTWEGSFESDVSGLHKFILTSAGYAKLWIDGELLFDRWRVCWNTSSNRFDLPMEAGKRYKLAIEWIPDGGESFIALHHLDPLPTEEQNRISFYSEVAQQIDYYFVAGSNLDEVISGYRTLTGKAPMMPKWAMGFWQSRERYKTQAELMDVVKEYRKRQIPIDNIVLDWQYWPIDKWGDHAFDSTRFPDPKGMMNSLHDMNTRLMISVWPKYYEGTANYDIMDRNGWLYKRNIELQRKDWLGYVSTFYDAFNADARREFWNQINTELFSIGVDAWWMDATEPDITSNLPMDERKALMHPTALGPAAQYFNAFSLVQAKGVYEGQRETSPNQRVFILTRSAFAGLQRFAAANWSGDIAARWHDMKAQIPCGLNVCLSGIPYWTMDIGGFAVESRYYEPNASDLDEWRELMTRWFQFGTFTPLFRVHGQYPFREIFNIAPESHPAYKSMVEYNKLRYRLMPYIYSLSGATWLTDYTIMRALPMDFASDANTFNIDDQFMFGPSLLINPVYEYKARSRRVYLPKGFDWYNFSTGEYFTGGQPIEAPAPYNSIPVFVKAGSIIPVGPAIQHTMEKPDAPLSIFVFDGADGDFTLYEDEGVNNNYERGDFSTIHFSYSSKSKSLYIAQREGEFDGMSTERELRIVVITPKTPKKLDIDGKPDLTLTYSGKELNIDLSKYCK